MPPRRKAESDGRGRALAWGGVAGPVAFLAAWVTAGALRPGYDPVQQAISRLAAAGTPTRVLMTSGFGGLATGLLAAAGPLSREAGRPSGLAVAATGLATVGVALTPLHGTEANAPHSAFAVAGYATLAAAPLLAAPLLSRTAGRRWAVASLLAGTLAAGLLAASGSGPAPGLFQRLGLTTGHAWVAAAGAAVATGRLSRPHS